LKANRNESARGGSIGAVVSDVLIFADTGHSAELRHELPVTVGDPIL
jgi:hypothetical protein